MKNKFNRSRARLSEIVKNNLYFSAKSLAFERENRDILFIVNDINSGDIFQWQI
jgi:hypothetical protein